METSKTTSAPRACPLHRADQWSFLERGQKAGTSRGSLTAQGQPRDLQRKPGSSWGSPGKVHAELPRSEQQVRRKQAVDNSVSSLQPHRSRLESHAAVLTILLSAWW